MRRLTEYGKYLIMGILLGIGIDAYTTPEPVPMPVKTTLTGYDLIRAHLSRQYQCEALECLKQPIEGLDFKRFETLTNDLEE